MHNNYITDNWKLFSIIILLNILRYVRKYFSERNCGIKNVFIRACFPDKRFILIYANPKAEFLGGTYVVVLSWSCTQIKNLNFSAKANFSFYICRFEWLEKLEYVISKIL